MYLDGYTGLLDSPPPMHSASIRCLRHLQALRPGCPSWLLRDWRQVPCLAGLLFTLSLPKSDLVGDRWPCVELRLSVSLLQVSSRLSLSSLSALGALQLSACEPV